MLSIDQNSFRLVSLENIQTDVQDLTRGLENARKELVIRQNLKVCDELFHMNWSFSQNDLERRNVVTGRISSIDTGETRSIDQRNEIDTRNF